MKKLKEKLIELTLRYIEIEGGNLKGEKIFEHIKIIAKTIQLCDVSHIDECSSKVNSTASTVCKKELNNTLTRTFILFDINDRIDELSDFIKITNLNEKALPFYKGGLAELKDLRKRMSE